MAEHSTTVLHPTSVESPDAFLADRERFWGGFTHFVFWSAAAIVVLLILMAFFLL